MPGSNKSDPKPAEARTAGPGEVVATKPATVQDQLDSLNAQARARRNPGQALRRSMEAALERKTRKARGRQRPASAGYKSPI
jgi:hypothetical protein